MYVKEQYIIVLHVHDVIVKKLAGPFILTKKKIIIIIYLSGLHT